MNTYIFIFSSALGFFLGSIVAGLLLCGVQILTGLLTGFIPTRIRFLCFEILREMVQDGAYTVRCSSFVLSSNVVLQPKDFSSHISKKKDKLQVLLTDLLLVVILVMSFIIYFSVLGYTGKTFFLGSIAEIVSAGILGMIALNCSTFILISIFALLCPESSRTYFNSKIREMGEKGVKATEMPPLETLTCKRTPFGDMKYQFLSLMKAEHEGNIDAMVPVAEWMNKRIMDSEPKSNYIGECGALLFYYTYYCRNNPAAYERANYYFSLLKPSLEKAFDSNDKRIYAYYKYYIQHDPAGARELAVEGLRMLSTFPNNIPDFKEGERMWLDHLIQEIDWGRK